MSVEQTEYLPLALRHLDDAISALTAPKVRTHKAAGRTRVITKPSIYAEMLENIRGQQGTSFGGVARSMPPLWVDGVDWINKVDSTVQGWWPSTGGTLSRLEAFHKASWRPQDTNFLDGASEMINDWVTAAESLLDGGRDHFTLNAPCPTCGEAWVYRKDALGENVRAPALNVSNMGCNCLACGHHWGFEYFTHLAKVIDCAPLEGVIADESNAV
ncbi:DUF7341 domain-containing protein [Rhodococcus globerulus]|uniref:DUF7341 domain-containing protein n=1 Tax=Rhodococcus globerulus TaxID=33008 RepID=UPI001C563A2D|nr:hypothetical protein [Rhodococcus globerulus]QXW04025.1 hypothetical protein KYT97_08400 [Rhodococcus globerulus]